MKRDDDATIDLAGRLRDLDHFTGVLARRRVDAEAIPVHPVPAARVPVPRRSRVFLRSGAGHGVFADLTLTAPHPRPAMD